MKKILFLALMLVGGMAAQAQDVLVGVYDLDKESVEDNAIKGTQTIETKTTIVAPLELTTNVTADDVMEVTSEVALEKVTITKKGATEPLRVIDLAKAKSAAVDLKPYGTDPIVVEFFAENGQSTSYTWE